MSRRENPFIITERRSLGHFPAFPLPIVKELDWQRLPINEQQAWHARLGDLKAHVTEQNLLLVLLQVPQVTYEQLSSHWGTWYPVKKMQLTTRWAHSYTKQQILLYTLGQLERSFDTFPLNSAPASSHVFCSHMLSNETLRVYKEQKSSKDITPLLRLWQQQWAGREAILINKILTDDSYQEIRKVSLADLITALNG